MIDKKKKIIIVIQALPIGGTETALIGMLSKIDYTRYDVDLLLLRKRGERLKDVPVEVNILESSKKEWLLLGDKYNSIVFLREGHFSIWAIIRLLFSFTRWIASLFGITKDSWKGIRRFLKPVSGKYNIAVDYSGFLSRYVVDRIEADIKISWNHFTYTYFATDKKNDAKYFRKLDYIVAVSVPARDTLQNNFPDIKDKIFCMYNILDEDRILKLSKENITENQILREKGNATVLICSVGRLEKQKDFALSIMAADLLKKRGIRFLWYVVGEGSERISLENLIARYKLEKHFLLLGAKENPYPYISNADIYVQTSVVEGRCVSVTEAKFLRVPCVVSDIQGLNDLVDDGVTGNIVERTPEAVADGILSLTADKRIIYRNNLENSREDNDESMEIFYRMVEGEA